jgi:L-alanine-DL-glutamate epimerase-like enolase superfamily enzyme
LKPARIVSLSATPIDVPMREPFEIAGGAQTRVRNVLVRLRLSDGTTGWGEGAPMASFNGETQEKTLEAVRAQRYYCIGKDIGSWRPLLENLDARLGRQGAARAAMSMALLDAWTRRARMPLRSLFGAAQSQVRSDVTVAIVPPERARAQAKALLARGIRLIKVKVGKDVDDDEQRVRAVADVSPRLKLMLDANQGYRSGQALSLLRRLRRHGITPVLFEQPVPKDDWEGLARVQRLGRVPVAADETISCRADALKMARLKTADVVNIKLMKCGILEAWDIALICRAAGLKLMMGGMIESSLAMAAAAHFAAGLGGFSFIDLDTPLWFARDPMRGVRLSRSGLYDLAPVRSGIGVSPRGT